jgi:GH24 family phage-related lysozyme (muramidase)
MTKTPIRLFSLFRYFKGLPHQCAAIHELEQLIQERCPEVFDRDQPWYGTWSSSVSSKEYGPAIQLIKEFEGCHLNAYLCPAGVPTIGFGNTRYPSGVRVKLGDTITQLRAEEMVMLEIERVAEILSETVPYWDDMNINQHSALISFAFNLGAYFYGNSGFNTISRVLAAKAWNEVPGAMLLYRNPGSHFEAGLLRRRKAEGAVWSK